MRSALRGIRHAAVFRARLEGAEELRRACSSSGRRSRGRTSRLIIESLTHDTVANQIRKRLLVSFGLTQTLFPLTETMPDPWARGYTLNTSRSWEDVSNTVPVEFMWSAGAMISDMNDIRRWSKLYATGKASGAATHRDLIDCIPFLGNTSFGLGIR
jgi:D-alanyl-D-alanine carboxypeptidase